MFTFSGLVAFEKCIKAKIEVCEHKTKVTVLQFLDMFIVKVKDNCSCKHYCNILYCCFF